MKIGRHGQLQEWLVDWDNPRDQHSHVSHMYGLFPSSQINRHDIFGFFLFESNNNTLNQNTARRNDSNGFDVRDGVGNTFRGNVAKNSRFGFTDPSSGSGTKGTGNRYANNRCVGNDETDLEAAMNDDDDDGVSNFVLAGQDKQDLPKQKQEDTSLYSL